MKKSIILITFFMFALWGCESGNQNANQPAAQEETTQVVEQEVPAAPVSPVYVLSDQYGERFLLQTYFGDGETPQPDDSLKNYKYIIYDGHCYPVRFKGVQLENKEENYHRDTYYNFDNLSGWVYEMEQGRLLENPENEDDAIWGAALLVDENYKNTTTIFDLKNRENRITKEVAVSGDLQKAFENKYGRKIMTISASAVFGDNSEYQLVNVQFKNKGDEALGVTALVENGEIKAVKEFPATYNETSTWRVDDEGEFYGLWANLIAMEDGTLTIYTSNSGEESSNYQNYVIQGDSLAEGSVSASFYHAPM